MDWSKLSADELAVSIPILAILAGVVIALTSMWMRHRERMAMIERGMHPDHPPEEADAASSPVERAGRIEQ